MNERRGKKFEKIMEQKWKTNKNLRKEWSNVKRNIKEVWNESKRKKISKKILKNIVGRRKFLTNNKIGAEKRKICKRRNEKLMKI